VTFKYKWAKYLLFVNTDLSPYFMGGKPPFEGMTLGFSVTVLVVYWLLFYLIAWLLFTKRDVAG
jgi:ABC-2 type transport system permease protein